MTTLAQLQQAYASLQQVFKTTFSPELTALAARIQDDKATLDDVQGQLDSARSTLDTTYGRVESMLAQAQQIEPRPSDFIAQLENSLNVNRPRNYQLLEDFTAAAAQNQAQAAADVDTRAAADQGPGTESAGSELDQASQARDQSANSQNPPVPPETLEDGQPSTASQTVPTSAQEFTAPGSASAPAAPSTLPGNVSNTAITTATLPQPVRTAPLSSQQSDAAFSYIYKATRVISFFERGQFFQDLEGVLLIFPDPPVNTTATNDNYMAAQPAVETQGRPGTGTTTAPSRQAISNLNGSAGDNLASELDTSSSATTPQLSGSAGDSLGPAQNTPPTSVGASVAVTPSSDLIEASAQVGGFTIKALGGSGADGISWVLIRDGQRAYAFDPSGLYGAAQQLQSRTLGGIPEDVIEWQQAGGADALAQQVQNQLNTRPSTNGTTQNMAREN